MPYKDPEKEKLRSRKRLAYFREYHRNRYKGSSVGYEGEELALKTLIGSKKIARPCDISWEGKLVDVKTAKPTNNKGSYRWKFLLSTQKKTADLYLLIRKDIDDTVIDIHLVPNTRKNNLSFNKNTVIKYKKYLLSLL